MPVACSVTRPATGRFFEVACRVRVPSRGIRDRAWAGLGSGSGEPAFAAELRLIGAPWYGEQPWLQRGSAPEDPGGVAADLSEEVFDS